MSARQTYQPKNAPLTSKPYKSSSVKSSAKKSSTSKTSATKTDKVQPLEVNNTTSAGVRKIENGYLVTESGTTGKGKNQQWFSKEYYSATNPLANVKKVSFGKK